MSLETPGWQYKCLDLKKIQARREVVVEFSHAEVMTILDCCAAFLDVDAVEPTGKKAKDTKWRIQTQSATYNQGRVKLHSLLASL